MSRLTKPAWTNRFQSPRCARRGLARTRSPVRSPARTRLLEVEGMKESISWQGIALALDADLPDGRGRTRRVRRRGRISSPIRLPAGVHALCEPTRSRGRVQRLKKWVRRDRVRAICCGGVLAHPRGDDQGAQVDDLFGADRPQTEGERRAGSARVSDDKPGLRGVAYPVQAAIGGGMMPPPIDEGVSRCWSGRFGKREQRAEGSAGGAYASGTG